MGKRVAPLLRLPFLVLALSAASPLAAQQVALRLTVRDSAGLGIPFASAVVIPSGRIVGGDQHGHIPVSGLRPELDTLIVRAIGYHPRSVPVPAADTGHLALVVILARAPFVLPEITVASGTAFDPVGAFHQRVLASGGRFVARWQIDRTGYIRASQVFQTVLGVRYESLSQETGEPVIHFPGCQATGSRVAVFIDGRETGMSPVPEDHLAWQIDQVSAREVEAMEVYRRRGEIPARFRSLDACAAVVIWTDRLAR